ncbi:MAG: GGDEF domain-containing protein [Spirochaetaceae bacterium]
MINIGIIVTDLFDFYQQTFLNGFRSYCEENDMRVFTFVGGYAEDYMDTDKEKNSLFNVVHNSSLDVLCLLSAPLSSLSGLIGMEEFIKLLPNIPLISIGLEIPGIPSILVDNKCGVSSLMDHLIEEHGHKNIGFIKGPETNQEAVDRFEAYKESLERHNIKYNYKLVAPGAFKPGDGRRGISLILDTRQQDVDAIFCCHDFSAFEVIDTIKARGLNVPSDIAVVGFDNLDRSSSSIPALTTIRQPIFNIGVLAAKYADKMLNGEIISTVKIGTDVMLRQSCGCQRGITFNTPILEENNNLTIEEALNNTANKIIKKYTFKHDIGDILNVFENSVRDLVTTIIKCEKEQNVDLMVLNITKILEDTSYLQLDASFWKFVLEDFYNALTVSIPSKNRLLFISSLFSRSILQLYETEKKLLDFKRVDDRSLIQFINNIGDRLLTCKKDSELKKLLKNNLLNLKVKHCFIVLFTETPGIGELYFSQNVDRLLDNEVYTFNLENIMPKDLGEANNLSYVVSSLRIDGIELGYMLFESGDSANIMYSFVVDKVAYGFKNIFQIKKMKSYTQQLEKAVEDRTKELSIANRLLKDRSMKDQLTNLYNRRFLDEIIIPQIQNNPERRFGIILIDLDHFKLVNDVYGHTSGDTVLKELGKILGYSLRPEDYVIRLGGEEFLLVLPDFNGDDLKPIITKIRNNIKETPFIMQNTETIYKTCSLGAIIYKSEVSNHLDFRSAISIIDKCLYHAKENGRNLGIYLEIDITQFIGCKNTGDYIINNFEKCLGQKKINLVKC